MRRCSPVATCISTYIAITLVQEALLTPYQLRTVPDRASVDAHLLHHRTDAGTARILTLVLTDQFAGHIVPAAVVVAHTVILGQTGEIRAPADALIVVETAGMGVLIKEHDRLGILPAGFEKVLVGLQFSHGVGAHVVVAATPAHGEETTVLVRHLHQIGKQCPAAGCRHRTQVASIAKRPELLRIVPA